jgi:hypothetical protein
MKGRYTLILLVLNFAVFGTIVYLHILKNNQLEEVATQSDIFSLNLNEIDYLEIQGSELDTPRIFQKRNGEWLITSPSEWRANLHAVNRLLNQIRWLKPQGEFSWEETRSFGQSLENYGLAGDDKLPRLSITVGVGSQKETLRLGANTTVGKRIYALSPNGHNIYVLPQKIEEVLLMQLDDLRSRSILSVPPSEISVLRIQNREGESRTSLTTLIREGKQWNFETPIRARASSMLVEETLNRLNQVQATQFLDLTPDQFEQYGVASGKLSIQVEGDNQKETLLIGNKVENNNSLQGPHVYARVTRFPTVFIIPTFQMDRLYEPQVLLRERRILDFRGRIPNEIRIREQDRELSLQKPENGAWQFLRKNDEGEFRPEKADQPLLDFIVDYLDRIRVLEFVMDAPTQEDLNRFGLHAPIQEVTILNPGEQTLLIGALAGEDGLYAQKKGEPFVYKIPDMLLDWITSDPLFYRDRILQRLPSGAHIQSISWGKTDSDSAKIEWQLNGQGSGQASTEEPSEGEALLKSRMAQLLRELEVDRYISETFPKELRVGNQTIPWEQKLTMTWSLRGGNDANQVSRTFYFSPKTADGAQYGGSPELDVVFTLTPAWVELLESLQDRYTPANPEFGPPPGEAPRDPFVSPDNTQDASEPAKPDEKEASPAKEEVAPSSIPQEETSNNS